MLENTIDTNLEPGQMLSHYQIIQVLGSGSMGTVYKAQDTKLGRLVAIKTFQVAKNFDKEAKMMALFNHPGIIGVYEVSDNPVPHIAMEYIEGMTLKEWAMRLAASRQPEERKEKIIVHVFIKLAEALQELHKNRLEHLDIKPGNILMTRGNIPKLMDFGISHNEKDFQEGTIAGTPNYMAPEQAQGKPTLKSDIYALGATMYEVITGYPPFRGDSPMNIIFQLLKSEPSTIREINQLASVDIEAICLKCLNKKPENRYASAKQLTRDLYNYLEHKPLLARKIGKWDRACRLVMRNKTVFTVIGIIIFILASFLLLMWMKNNELEALNQELRQKNIHLVQKDAIHYCDRGLIQKKFAEEAFINHQDPTPFYQRALNDYLRSIAIAESVNYDYAKPYNNIAALLLDTHIEKEDKKSKYREMLLTLLQEKITKGHSIDKIIESYLEKAIKIDPHYPDPYYNLGVLYQENKDYHNAITKFTKAINCNFEDSTTYQADLNLEGKNNDDNDSRAKREFTQEIVEGYFKIGKTYSNLKNQEEAKKNYDLAIKNDPYFAQAYFNKGNIYRDEQNWQEAIECYTKTIEYSPNDFEAYVNRGNIYFRMELLDEALKDYQKYLTFDYQNIGVLENCGKIFAQKAEPQKAIYYYEQAIFLGSSKTDVYLYCGLCYLKIGNIERPKELYKKLLIVAPDSKETQKLKIEIQKRDN